MEFSETNCDELLNRGFDVKNDVSAAAKGSEEAAYNLLNVVSKESLDIGVHYCS
ncbi:MAG TPA: radical SAM protein, partial [Thermoplasmata archaeon]|nr:radical SAM protein [Thermoplasmata archaeon]